MPSNPEGAYHHFDRPACGERAKFAYQIAERIIVERVAKFLQHCGETFSRQQGVRRPCRQPAPAQRHSAGGADVIAGLCQQHGIAQGCFILDASRLLCGNRGGAERQPLPPCASPSFLPADHRVERAERGAGGKCDIRNVLRRKGLRLGDGAPQPSRQRDRRGNSGGAGECRVARQGRFGPENHREKMKHHGAFGNQLAQYPPYLSRNDNER